MELRKFKVERYRSISAASLDLRDLTVLVGPNNEGKSNILRAMVLGMTALDGFSQFDRGPKYRMSQYMRGPVDYDWDRDFPMNQRGGSSKNTALQFDFLLDESEISDFESVVGSKINGDLKVRLSFTQDGSVSIRIVKKRAGKVWTTKAGHIAAFVGSRIGVEYVPSVRTSGEAERVVARLVARELMSLEQQPEYRDALRVIEDLQRPRLQDIGRSVQETLAHFLPDVVSVDLNVAESRRFMGGPSRSVEIIVDDGHATSLEHKGDGIQSLAAIALLRRAAMDRGRTRTFVLAVEEPEAHLHPFAIRELRTVLGFIAQDQQVVLTTHSPLLADPLHVDRNVIVEDSKAKAARSISDVRNSLGVRLEDNLQSARLVLVTEGDHDVIALTSALSCLSSTLKDYLAQGTLVIEGLGGGGKLKYRLSQYSGGVCATYVLVDNDQQGRASVESALRDKLISDADYVLSTFPGKSESEMEDFVDPSAYLDDLNKSFGTNIRRSEILRGRKKWSLRIRKLVEARGKLWNSSAERRAKALVASAVQNLGTDALLPEGVVALTAVARRLEHLLGHEPMDEGATD